MAHEFVLSFKLTFFLSVVTFLAMNYRFAPPHFEFLIIIPSVYILLIIIVYGFDYCLG